MRSGDELVKYQMSNSMAINLHVFGGFMKSRLLTRKIAVWLSQYLDMTPIWENQASEEMNVPKASQRETCIIASYSASTL